MHRGPSHFLFVLFASLVALQSLSASDHFIPEVPNLHCVRQLRDLRLNRWYLREFQLSEPLFDAFPNKGADGIEIQTGRSLGAVATAVVTFNPKMPPERRIEYLDEEDTSLAMNPYVYSKSMRYMAHFNPAVLKVALFDLEDPENQTVDGEVQANHARHVIDLSEILRAEAILDHGPLSFAPRFEFFSSEGSSIEDRLLISTPFRFLEYSIESGALLKMQSRAKPSFLAVTPWQRGIITSSAQGVLAQDDRGLFHPRVFGKRNSTGPFHRFDAPTGQSYLVSPLADQNLKGKFLIGVFEEKVGALEDYSLQWASEFDSGHKTPITWMKVSHGSILSYAAEENRLLWANFNLSDPTPHP